MLLGQQSQQKVKEMFIALLFSTMQCLHQDSFLKNKTNFPCLHLQSSGVHAFLGYRLPLPVHSHDVSCLSPSPGDHLNNLGGLGKALIK